VRVLVQVIAPLDDVDEAVAPTKNSRHGLAGQIWIQFAS
jgi:hypothetical protein